jgi:hypothetical protein
MTPFCGTRLHQHPLIGDLLNVSKLPLCLFAALVLSAPLSAQLSAPMVASVALPDEPQPQPSTLTLISSSSSQSAPSVQSPDQTPAPAPQNQTETDAERKARGDAQIREETHQRIAGATG